MLQSRIVPVQEDLTKEELRLSVLRGLENCFRVDKKLSVGESIELGEWGVLQNDGTMARPGATPVASTYLVFCGSERFDSMATGQVTLIMNSNCIVKSNRFNQAGSYSVGSELTVKDLGAGEAQVTPAANGEFVFGKVVEVGSGYLVYEVFAAPHKKA
jgi:hypothetical protein